MLLAASLASLAAAANREVLVNADALSLRVKSSTSAKRIATLVTFQPVTVVETKGSDWTKVRTKDGKSGWVLSRYLTKTGCVSVKQKYVNARQGPGTEYVKLFEFYKNYPLRVIDVASNGWLRVSDFDGDEGWVHPNFVKTKPVYVIARLAKCNVRDGAGVDNELKFTAARGVLFEVLKEKDGWLNVKHADGDTGWLSAKIVFGWRDKKPKD